MPPPIGLPEIYNGSFPDDLLPAERYAIEALQAQFRFYGKRELQRVHGPLTRTVDTLVLLHSWSKTVPLRPAKKRCKEMDRRRGVMGPYRNCYLFWTDAKYIPDHADEKVDLSASKVWYAYYGVEGEVYLPLVAPVLKPVATMAGAL